MKNIPAINEACLVCEDIIDERINLIEGCRMLSGLRHKINDQSCVDLFFPMVGVDSETDHLPIGKIREECSESFLQSADKEMDAYIGQSRDHIIDSCKVLLEALKNLAT